MGLKKKTQLSETLKQPEPLTHKFAKSTDPNGSVLNNTAPNKTKLASLYIKTDSLSTPEPERGTVRSNSKIQIHIRNSTFLHVRSINSDSTFKLFDFTSFVHDSSFLLGDAQAAYSSQNCKPLSAGALAWRVAAAFAR